MSFLKRLVPVKANMTVTVQSLTVENGQPITGAASLSSSDSFKVEGVRMEVRVTEGYQEQAWERDSNGNMRQVVRKKEDKLYSQDVPISQAFDVGKGDSKEFPFQVAIPMRSPSRFGGVVTYSLKAVANIKGRPDVTKTVNPMVVPAVTLQPGFSSGGMVTQVIQKEVIKVPCQYCGSLIELTSGVTKCPTCSAPLRLH